MIIWKQRLQDATAVGITAFSITTLSITHSDLRHSAQRIKLKNIQHNTLSLIQHNDTPHKQLICDNLQKHSVNDTQHNNALPSC
jgi:hypothetical protein